MTVILREMNKKEFPRPKTDEKTPVSGMILRIIYIFYSIFQIYISGAFVRL